MNTRRKLLMLVFVACSFAAAADEPRGLENNPFQRPDIADAPRLMPDVMGGSDETGLELDLRITLIAGRERLARVGETLLRPGDEVEGYTLVRVYENRAVFERSGKEITVHVKPGLLAGDERRNDERSDD